VARFDAAVDDLWARRLRGRPAWDRVMYAASAVGEHSMAWLVLAGAEGWRRGAPARTLARAGVALGAESALVNGAVKSAFRRPRPVEDAPRPHYLRQPLSSSFPSGHASSAFFAAALLRDSPWAPVYYGLAVVIATSRAHVRIHHASDVVAGAALGALLGEVARRTFPVLPGPGAG
jgi:membrane-associated phospholipid phosphatase